MVNLFKRFAVFVGVVLLLCTVVCVGSAAAAETLTVVYCEDQTMYPFSATVNGNVGITVKDSRNYYYRYYPALESSSPRQAKMILAGTPSSKTWQVVNYLGSDGYISSASTRDAYINTGLMDDSTTKYIGSTLDFKITKLTAYAALMGVRLQNEQSYFRVRVNSDGSIALQYVTPSSISNPYSRTTVTFTAAPFVSNANMVIFAANDALAGGVGYLSNNYNLYSAKFLSNNVLVRDYIPIRIGTGEYALYDKVLSGGVIYHNSGSGTFGGGGTPTPLTYSHQEITPDITAVTLTSPTPAFYTDAITAAVTASSPAGEPLTYQWYVSTNSGSTWSAISGATTAALSYTPTAAGIYTFKVTATNSAGSTDSWTAGFRSVTAKALTNPTFTQQPAFSAAQGTLTAQPSMSFVVDAHVLGDTSVMIYSNTVQVSGTGGTWQTATTNTFIGGIWTLVKPIHYSDTAGTTHTYTTTVTTFVGSSWDDPNKRIIGEVTSQPFSFTTYAAPVFTSVSIYPTTAAVPATITFSATATDATSIIYQLSSDDITWSQITSPYTINQVGTYYFRAVASGYGGQTYSDTQTITVSDLAPVIESAAASPTSGLIPFSVTFTASATNNPTYTWYQRVNGLDRQIGTGTPFVYQFGSGLAAGVYKFRVKAHNEYGDTYSPDISVTVGALPGTIITGPSAGSSFMQRQTITFTASSSSQFDTSYSWSFSDGGTASGASVYHSFQNIGEASATVTGTNQFGSDSATIRLQILEYSSVSVSVSDISAVGATFTGLIAESSIDPTTKMHFEIMSKSGTVLWKTDDKLYSQSNTFTAEGMPLISGQMYKVRAVTDKYGNSIDVSFTLNEASRNAPDKLGTVYESSGLNRDPFNVTKLVDGSTDVLGSALGGGTVGKAIAFGVIVLFLVVGLWLRQGDVIIPVTIGLAGGWFIIGNLPGEWQPVAYTILVISIVAIFWVIFKKRVE